MQNAKIALKFSLKSGRLLEKTLEYAEDTRSIRRGMQNTREKREETRRGCTGEGANQNFDAKFWKIIRKTGAK